MIQLDFSKPAPKPSSIEECHAVIDALWNFCGTLQKEVEFLKQEVMALKKENAELKERLNSNSNNSSKPPSTDFKKKTNNRKGSGRNPGAQPGHKGISRTGKFLPFGNLRRKSLLMINEREKNGDN